MNIFKELWHELCIQIAWWRIGRKLEKIVKIIEKNEK